MKKDPLLTSESLAAAEPTLAVGDVPPPKSTKRGSILFLAGSLASGNLVAMALRMVGGIILARLVAPSTLGLFAGIGLALGYAPVLQLGILNGLNRELPYFVGKGDTQKVKELAAAAQAWALIVGTVVFLALTGIAAWQLAHGEMWKAAGWFTNAILALFLFYSTYYLQMTFRSAHDFARLAWTSVVEGVVALLSLALVALLSFYGMCLRVIVASAVSTVILYRWRPVRVAPKWNTGHLKHLLIIGAPIFGVGQIYGWWGGVVNSTLVLKFSGTTGMGLYSMVLVAIAALEIIPTAVAQVIYPRMAEQYGRGCSKRALVRITWKPMVATAAGLALVVVAGWFAIGPLVRLIIPKYADAVPAMQWALLLPFINSFQPLNSIFNVVRRQDLYIASIALGIAAYGGGLIALLHNEVQLTAFPQAMLIGRVVFMATCYLFVWRLQRKEPQVEAPHS